MLARCFFASKSFFLSTLEKRSPPGAVLDKRDNQLASNLPHSFGGSLIFSL
jgi:hypothetical protein